MSIWYLLPLFYSIWKKINITLLVQYENKEIWYYCQLYTIHQIQKDVDVSNYRSQHCLQQYIIIKETDIIRNFIKPLKSFKYMCFCKVSKQLFSKFLYLNLKHSKMMWYVEMTRSVCRFYVFFLLFWVDDEKGCFVLYLVHVFYSVNEENMFLRFQSRKKI